MIFAVIFALFVTPIQLKAESKMQKLRRKASSAILNEVEVVIGADKVEKMSSNDETKLLRKVDSMSTKIAANKDKLEHLLDNWEDLYYADPDHVRECKDCNNLLKQITAGTSLAQYVPRYTQILPPGYPSGYQLTPCNCNMMMLGTRRPNIQCQSGGMVAIACYGMCTPYTYQWAWFCE